MCKIREFFEKQRIDTIGQHAVRLQKTVILLFMLTLGILIYSLNAFAQYFDIFLIAVMSSWVVLACGFKGSYKRRSWQLILYNILTLAVVFVVTFVYTYKMYMEIHNIVEKHVSLTMETVLPLIIIKLYYLTWMILTIVSMIKATQIVVLLRLGDCDKQSDDSIEYGIPMDNASDFAEPYVKHVEQIAEPKVMFYYPLSVPVTEGSEQNYMPMFTLAPAQ